MLKFSFKVDIKRDAWNWWYICNKESQRFGMWLNIIPREVYTKLSSAPEEKAHEVLGGFLEKLYREKGFPEYFRRDLKQAFLQIKTPLFKRLEEVIGRPFCREHITFVMTTAPRMPYNFEEGIVFLNVFQSPVGACATIAHELLHFQFHHYFEGTCREIGLTKNQITALKEALTVLLNEGFLEILRFPNQNHQKYKMLESELVERWRKGEDFAKLISQSQGIFALPEMRSFK